MASKVVHLPDDAHAAAKEYCARNGLRLTDWVSALIQNAVSAGFIPSQGNQPRITLAPTVDTTPVKKKPMTVTPTGEEDGSGSKPWEQPPFWKRAKEEGAPKQEAKAGLEGNREEPSARSGDSPGGEVIRLR